MALKWGNLEDGKMKRDRIGLGLGREGWVGLVCWLQQTSAAQSTQLCCAGAFLVDETPQAGLLGWGGSGKTVGTTSYKKGRRGNEVQARHSENTWAGQVYLRGTVGVAAGSIRDLQPSIAKSIVLL